MNLNSEEYSHDTQNFILVIRRDESKVEFTHSTFLSDYPDPLTTGKLSKNYTYV